MKLIFAVPLENSLLSSHFGHSEQFAIINVENNIITNETIEIPPPHDAGILPKWLTERGVTDVIAGGMGQRMLDILTAKNIKVNIGAKTKTPKELVTDWLNNSLETGTNVCKK